MDVPVVDECFFDGGEFPADFFEVGIEVLLVVFQLLFDSFFADEQACESGEEQFEFLEKRHGLPHGGEEGLSVGVDESDGELMGLGVGDGGEHLVSGVDAVFLCHAFLELGKQAVDQWEVFSCVLIGGRIGVAKEDGLVSLGVEFDAYDLWLFFVEEGEKRR